MERESVVARDFMGLSSCGVTETEVDSKERPDCGNGRILNLGLLKDGEANCPGAGLLQLSAGFDTGRHCSLQEGKQSPGGDSGGVAFKLGSSGTGLKGFNASGSGGGECALGGKAYVPGYGAEVQRSLSRFAAAASCVGKEGAQYASEKAQRPDRERPAGGGGGGGRVSDAQTDSEVQQREEFRRCVKDKLSVPNMAMQWSYWNKAATLQQLLPFKNPQEERPEKRKFGELASSAFHPLATADIFKSNQRSTSVTQKAFDLDSTSRDTAESGNYLSGASGPPNRQFVVSPTCFPIRTLEELRHSDHPGEQARAFPSPNVSLSVSSFKERMGSFISLNGQQATSTSCIASTPLLRPFSGNSFTSQPLASNGANSSSGSSTVSRPASNDPGKLASAQLTIFYAGTVNVYDDVPLDKAHSIMLLASSGSNTSAKMADPPSQHFGMSIPVATGGHSSPAIPTACSTLPSALPPISPQIPSQKPRATSVQLSQPALVSSSAKECHANHNSTGTTSSQQEAPKGSSSGSIPSAVVPRALPLARKASLTRFLEKRKERVHSNVPCSTNEASDHSCSQGEKSMLSFDGCLSSQRDLAHGEALGEPVRRNSTVF